MSGLCLISSIPQAFHVLQPQQLQEKDVLELVNVGGWQRNVRHALRLNECFRFQIALVCLDSHHRRSIRVPLNVRVDSHAHSQVMRQILSFGTVLFSSRIELRLQEA